MTLGQSFYCDGLPGSRLLKFCVDLIHRLSIALSTLSGLAFTYWSILISIASAGGQNETILSSTAGSSGSQKVGVHLFARLATVVALLMADG